MSATLFDGYEPLPEEPAEKLSADRRRTIWQRRELDAGRHPNTRAPLHADAAPVDDRDADGLRCGDCRFRHQVGYKSKTYAKCGHSTGRGDTSCAASDVRAWWPACIHFEPEEDGA